MVYLERRTYKQCFIVSLDSLENPDTFYVPGALPGCSGWFADHRIWRFLAVKLGDGAVVGSD